MTKKIGIKRAVNCFTDVSRKSLTTQRPRNSGKGNDKPNEGEGKGYEGGEGGRVGRCGRKRECSRPGNGEGQRGGPIQQKKWTNLCGMKNAKVRPKSGKTASGLSGKKPGQPASRNVNGKRRGAHVLLDLKRGGLIHH